MDTFIFVIHHTFSVLLKWQNFARTSKARDLLKKKRTFRPEQKYWKKSWKLRVWKTSRIQVMKMGVWFLVFCTTLSELLFKNVIEPRRLGLLLWIFKIVTYFRMGLGVGAVYQSNRVDGVVFCQLYFNVINCPIFHPSPYRFASTQTQLRVLLLIWLILIRDVCVCSYWSFQMGGVS